MRKTQKNSRFTALLTFATIFAISLFGGAHAAMAQEICEGFGPQTPRDIDSKEGKNPVNFSFAPSHQAGSA